MVQKDGLASLPGREPGIRRDLTAQRLLKISLLFKKSIEKRQIRRRDRSAVGVFRQQIVGVHGDQQGRIGIFRGNLPDGPVADRFLS
jgi:hypothetical protein